MALPISASLTIVDGHADHTVLAMVFGNRGHASENPKVSFTVSLTTVMLTTCEISYYLHRFSRYQVPIFWTLHKTYHSTEVMVGTTKNRIYPTNDIVNWVRDGIINSLSISFAALALGSISIIIFSVGTHVIYVNVTIQFSAYIYLKRFFKILKNPIFFIPFLLVSQR